VALPSIQLGPYQLHERIGEGGNGQVYRATGPAGTVAVKLVGNPNDFDEAGLARFRREIAALDELSHPNLIALLDHGVDPELGPYLVLPLLAGRTLRDVCRGAMCPEAALLLVLPIAEGAAALHARGFVHRDLKPENAIATPDGTITVIDLGLAWGEGMTRHTESGAAVGSIGYMSPEQLDGQKVDTAADVWAIGVMLYEAITGKRPFARPRPTEEVAATLLGAYSKLSAADRRAGEELDELVGRCLSLDPAKRPSIDELVAALREQIEWTDDIAAERAAAIADPAAYQARIAAFRVRRLERTAKEALDAQKPFVALALCDRGLAYAPEHPALLQLIAAAEAATAKSKSTNDVALAKTEAIKPEKPKASRNTMYFVGGTLAFVALVMGYAIYENVSKPDPWAAKPIQPTVTTTTQTPSSSSTWDESDKAIVRDFMGLFGKALDASSKAPKAPPGGAPTTASGWLQLAKTQDPIDAVTSVRHALTLSPDWPEAQDMLCVMLAATKDAGAIDACKKPIERDPRSMALRAARGVAYVNADRPVEALADLDAVVAADPDPKWRRLRAKARSAAGDDAGAQTDLEHACQLGDAVACQAKR
jgi:hypothetical protein